MADKITNDITLLFKTKLDEKSKQEIGKNLKGLLENAAIGFDEAETKRNVEPIIQMIKRLFDKAEIAFDADKLLTMPSRQALEEMAKIEVNQLQLAFDKALAKSGGVKIDFGDIGLSELAAPLKQIESELSDISRKVADTTKKSIYEIEQSLKSVSKNKSFKKIASPESIENTLIESSNDKKIHPSRAATQLEKARDLYDKSVKEDNPWVVQYKYLLDFVSKYEKLTHQAKTKIEAERPEFKQLYDMLSPKAGAVKISLEHYVDMARGNELSEYKNQPWAREKTLERVARTLENGISVKGDDGHSESNESPKPEISDGGKNKTPNTKITPSEPVDDNAAKQARIAEQEKIAAMLKQEAAKTVIAEQNDELKKQAEIIELINSLISSKSENEKFAYLNMQTGDASKYIEGEKEGMPISKIKQLQKDDARDFDSTLHTHPAKVAVPSPEDFENQYLKNFESFKKNFILATNEIAEINFSQLTEQQAKDLVGEYSKRVVAKEDEGISLRDGGVESIDISSTWIELEKQLTAAFPDLSMVDASAFNQKLFDSIEKLSNDIEAAFKSMMDEDMDADQFDDKLSEIRGNFLKQFKFSNKQRIDDYLSEKSDNMGEWDSKKIYNVLSKKLSPEDPSWSKDAIHSYIEDLRQTISAYDAINTGLEDIQGIFDDKTAGYFQDKSTMIDVGGIAGDVFKQTTGSFDALQQVYKDILVQSIKDLGYDVSQIFRTYNIQDFIQQIQPQAQTEAAVSQQNIESIERETKAQEELNAAENQNPPAQDDTSVHNANVEAINKEIEAYKQRDIERMSQGDITSLYWAAKHPETHDGELEAALQSNPNLISELTTQRDDLQGKLQPIQEIANKISQMSSIKDIPFDQLRQEAVNVGQRLSTMYDQGITDTEEYIALQYKLIKIIDQIGASYGGVKGSGAKDTSELRRWVRNSIESEFGKDPVDEKVVEALWGQGKFSIMKTDAQTFNQRDMAGRLLGTDEIFVKSDSDDLSKINLIIEALSKISPIANTAKTSIDSLNDSLQEKDVIENSDNNSAEIATEKAETDAINQQNEALKENIDLKAKANAQDSTNHILASLTKLEEITNKSLSEVINDYDNLDNSIKQNIDSILQSIGLMGSDGRFLFDRKQGGNAKAFVTDNFVILQKHITTNNEEISIFIEKLQQAKQEGIQLAEVLGQTFSLNAKENIGFRKGYEIQERGEGGEVHASPKLIELNQALAENQKILNLSDEHLQKFILDYIKLDQIGLQIDPSKPSNFLLDAEKGITFIDIGLKDVNAKAKSTADIFTEIATILSNMVGYMKFGENGDWSKSSGQIVNRIRDIFAQLNLSSSEEMNKIIEERFVRNNDMKSVLLPENTSIPADSSEAKASINTEELRGLLNSITYNVKVIQDAEPVEDNKVSINADELRSVLDGITYNVKLAQGESDNDSNKIAIDEGILENVLNRITYDVKIAHDDADKTANKIAIDESALEQTLNRVFSNILSPKDDGNKPESKKEPWALEKTLNTTIKGVLDQIQTNTAKVDAPSDTMGASESTTKLAEIKSILESINAKIVKGGVIATRDAVKQAAQSFEPDVKRQAARSNMMKSIINDYKTMGKLAAQFASDGNLETKAMLENLKEEIRRKRSSLNITMSENASLREKYSIAFEAEKKLLEAAKQQRKINEQNKADAKIEKKRLADAKKLAQREAMVGKAGNAVGRAENTWMTAVGMEDELPKEFGAQIDDYYQKLDALRKKQAELKNSDTISEEQKADLIAQTNNVNKLTEEIGGLIAEYQRLSGDNVDPTTIRANTIQPGANMDTYEQQLKNYVREITNGKGQIKGFNAETQTLTYTVKTGAHEFTTYTAAVRHLDDSLVSVRGATKKTETFLEATKRKMKEISSYMSGMALISRAGQELRRGIQYVREIDLALTELKKVTDETEESYDKFLETAAKTADKVGSTIQKVVSSTADWARLNI